MEHYGRAFAADEIDPHHLGLPEVASVHMRALITWSAIFPMAALGMSVIADVAPGWDPVLRALVLTAIVVPIAVYFAVPKLLFLYGYAVAKGRRWERRRDRNSKA